MLKTKSYKALYLTSAQSRAYIISPNWYMGIFSRGTGKTTRIQALRSYQTAVNVPAGLSVFYNATYIGAQQRTVASSLEGWRDFGLKEGKDYVVNINPTKHFKETNYQPLKNWKNTITYKNGHVFLIASNDRPGLVNSLSITGGIFVDEFRFIDEPLMRQDLYPAIRGKNKWGLDNPFVFSRTYTSDMPMITDDCGWAFDFKTKMNNEQIVLIVQAAKKVEKLRLEISQIYQDFESTDSQSVKERLLKKIHSLTITLQPKINALNSIRTRFSDKNGSVYFDTGSFIANLNVLGADYFFNNADPRNELVARTSYLNIKPDAVEHKFYARLHRRHFVTGNFNYDLIEEIGIPTSINETLVLDASYIKDYDPLKEIDIEIDFGDMCSCSISQTFGLEERYIASFEVLQPFSIDDLMTIVNNYLKHHINRKINVYKDPSGNHMLNKQKQTFGIQTVYTLRTLGWIVVDKTPVGSRNASHDAKFQLINEILSEKRKDFPYVRIIRETNQQLEASLNKAPRLLKISSDGTKQIVKDKSSEKELRLEDKPMNSTDHSDHFDIKLWHKYNRLLPGSNVFI